MMINKVLEGAAEESFIVLEGSHTLEWTVKDRGSGDREDFLVQYMSMSLSIIIH